VFQKTAWKGTVSWLHPKCICTWTSYTVITHLAVNDVTLLPPLRIDFASYSCDLRLRLVVSCSFNLSGCWKHQHWFRIPFIGGSELLLVLWITSNIENQTTWSRSWYHLCTLYKYCPHWMELFLYFILLIPLWTLHSSRTVCKKLKLDFFAFIDIFISSTTFTVEFVSIMSREWWPLSPLSDKPPKENLWNSTRAIIINFATKTKQ
jgi:hypothetical protein